MYSGFYTAASGMVTRSKRLNVVANNISNVNTTGFKKDYMVSTTFGEHLVVHNNNEIGQGVYGTVPDSIDTNFEQGAIVATGSPLDFSIEGEGFFTVQMEETVALTRNGSFSVNNEGYLIDSKGNLVLGENGPLLLANSSFEVLDNGDIYINNAYFDTLRISIPEDLGELVKVNEGLFLYNGNQMGDFTGKVKQGFKEESNVDMIKEMTEMMACSRGFQACSQVAKMMNEAMEKSVNEIAKL